MTSPINRTDLAHFAPHVEWTFTDPALKPASVESDAWEHAENTESLEGRITVELRAFARGGASQVYRATLSNGQGAPIKVAVKCFKYFRDGPQSPSDAVKAIVGRISLELKAWRVLDHPNIVKFYGIVMNGVDPGTFPPTDPLWPAIVSALCEGGTITAYLCENPDTPRLPLILDTAKGLEYLHTYEIVHGDMKPLNVLIKTTPDGIRAAITDFGCARILGDERYQGTMSYSWPYIAPEIMQPPYLYTKASDVFAFALTLFEVITGENIFPEEHDRFEARFKLYHGQRPERDEKRFSGDLWMLVEDCWKGDPDSRANMVDVAQRLRDML